MAIARYGYSRVSRTRTWSESIVTKHELNDLPGRYTGVGEVSSYRFLEGMSGLD